MQGAAKLGALAVLNSSFLGGDSKVLVSTKQSPRPRQILCIRAQASDGFQVPAAMPSYPPPPPMPAPPPARTTKPTSLIAPRVTDAELKIEVPEPTGLAALGLPELDLPEPPADPNAPPPRRYRSPYEKPEPPPRPYQPAKITNPRVLQWLQAPPPPKELRERQHFKLSPTCNMTIYFGDLTKWFVNGTSDAIVAPANKKINGGAAVDGEIHKAAGPRLLSACQRLPDVAAHGVKCEVGNAVATRPFDLPISRIIHAVGPIYEGRDSDADLERTYIAALKVAAGEGVSHIAFPAISCRIYGYPYAEGAKVALKALREHCHGFTQIDIVVRNWEGYEAFVQEALNVQESSLENQVN